MVILVIAPSTCHVTLLVLFNQDNQHESKDIQRLHCPPSTAASFVSSDSRVSSHYQLLCHRKVSRQ
ncbi:hypothetical protein K402DRAFT_393418 [Aulographum hederae CBS 113979]|uniref:Uncharacterized protein n=1 Tax=Aulographum hederae CBS 113979 TaxID=1176131 RepID=A0A6G1H155_9PEZI|nr:hypothetical protein K402DRAFT_393418 [Aulographum hederae CBS 113979]